MRRATFLLFLPTLALTSTTAAAQLFPDPDGEGPGPSETAAFLALSITPVGAFPDIIVPASSRRQPIGFRFHFGNLDEEGDISRRSFGAGIDIPAGTATLGFTLGVQDFVCPDEEDFGGGVTVSYDCAKALMGGASFGMPLVTNVLGAQGSSLALGLQGTIGYGTGEEVLGATVSDPTFTESFSVSVSGLSVTLGVPISVVAKSGGISVVPHITPRFGWGRATMKLFTGDPTMDEEDTESGTRFMLGGGVGVLLESGLGFTLGFQKIFIEDGSATIGLGVSWNR